MRVLAAIGAVVATAVASVNAQQASVAFGFGGAQTGDFNLVGAFAPQVVQAAGAQGLTFGTFATQLKQAEQMLYDVNSVQDLFWVYGGTNDILGSAVGLPADPAVIAGNIGAAMERLYALGARRFIVPNCYSVGRMPILNTFGIPEPVLTQVKQGMTGLTFGTNQVLLGVTAAFRAAHPDCEVTDIDVFTIVETAIAQGVFTNTASDCVTDNAATCAGYLFTDNVHMTSAGWALVAADIKSKITKPTRRIISIGDSYSDKGASMDLWLRSVGFATNLPPRFFAGRFSDGPNVIDQVEALLPTTVASTAVIVPFQTTMTATRTTEVKAGLASTPLKAEIAITGDFILPRFMGGAGGLNGDLYLTMDDMTCVYKYNGNYALAAGPAYVFARCLNNNKVGGMKISVNEKVVVSILSNGQAATASFTVSLYRYTCSGSCNGTQFGQYTIAGIVAGVISFLGLSGGLFMYKRQQRRNSMRIPQSTLTELAAVNSALGPVPAVADAEAGSTAAAQLPASGV